MNKITDKIFRALKERKIKVVVFAKEMGISRAGIYKWSDETIKFSTIKKISEYLDLPVTYFIDNNDNKKRHSPFEKQLKRESLKQQIKILKKIDVLKSEIKKEFRKQNAGRN